MSLGLFAKAARETWVATTLCALGAMALEALIAYAYPTFFEEMAETVLRLQFVQYVIKALVGAGAAESLGPGALSAIAWVHPILLAIIWVQEISFCTRIPAGEIDRGTIDLLLGLPVSRWRVYLCESAAWLISGAVVVGMAVLGAVLGGLTVAAEHRTPSGRLAAIVANLYCLYVAVGGLTWLVSALSDRRGRAVAVVLAVVLASFFLNFLAGFWQPAKIVSFLSFMDYYRPLHAIREQAWPVADMAVLTLVGAVLWFGGGLVFARRDICTT